MDLTGLTGFVDTTVLNNFAQVRQPLFLRAAFPSLAAPVPVMEELARGVDLGLLPAADWDWLARITLTPAEQDRAQDFSRKLGVGESACLAVAEARRGFVLTDDLEARRLASVLGLTVSGTLGVLDRLIRSGDLGLEAADEFLAKMIRCGYRSPVFTLRRFNPG